ncbi:MAG: hypothetical protein WCD21_12685 [Streptomyces sp.]
MRTPAGEDPRRRPDGVRLHGGEVLPGPGPPHQRPHPGGDGRQPRRQAVIVALRGLLARDAATLTLARDGLSDVRDKGKNSLFTYVTSGDGFYEDGSFVQHGSVAYTGTYGSVLLGSAGQLIALLADSEWAVTDPKTSILYEAVDRTFSPVVFDGLMMDAVRGRATSREKAPDHKDARPPSPTSCNWPTAPPPRTPDAGARWPRGG